MFGYQNRLNRYMYTCFHIFEILKATPGTPPTWGWPPPASSSSSSWPPPASASTTQSNARLGRLSSTPLRPAPRPSLDLPSSSNLPVFFSAKITFINIVHSASSEVFACRSAYRLGQEAYLALASPGFVVEAFQKATIMWVFQKTLLKEYKNLCQNIVPKVGISIIFRKPLKKRLLYLLT